MTFKPADGSEPTEMTVKEFGGNEGGRGGCGMGMFNTTEVFLIFSSFNTTEIILILSSFNSTEINTVI